jgi:hypothetical protein
VPTENAVNRLVRDWCSIAILYGITEAIEARAGEFRNGEAVGALEDDPGQMAEDRRSGGFQSVAELFLA